MELVRYIHLNPLRAGLVKGLHGLETYPYCGHGVLMAQFAATWQDIDYVLGCFGGNLKSARRSYREFVADGVSEGRRRDLVGGGLLRSNGGWRELRKSSKAGIRMKGDERILGSSEFVEKALKRADDVLERRMKLRAEGLDLETLTQRIASLLKIDVRDLKTPTKDRHITRARAFLCHLAVNDLAVSGAEVARALNISASTVSKSAKRGKTSPGIENVRKQIMGTRKNDSR